MVLTMYAYRLNNSIISEKKPQYTANESRALEPV